MWRAVEPGGVAFVGGGEGVGAVGADLGSGAEVHGRGGVQSDSAVRRASCALPPLTCRKHW